MKSRRWFVTPELILWRYMVASGQYTGPFFTFPHCPNWTCTHFPWGERTKYDWIQNHSILNDS